MFRSVIMIICAIAMLGMYTRCNQKGPGQKAGEQIDKAGQKINEKVDTLQKKSDSVLNK